MHRRRLSCPTNAFSKKLKASKRPSDSTMPMTILWRPTLQPVALQKFLRGHDFRVDGGRSSGDGGRMSDRIVKLKDAIETMHRCKAVHSASEPVVELFRGEVAWDGVVETFNLWGHPKAKRCHAWSYEEDGETQFVTVLEIQPVNSPKAAVKVVIASETGRGLDATRAAAKTRPRD